MQIPNSANVGRRGRSRVAADADTMPTGSDGQRDLIAKNVSSRLGRSRRPTFSIDGLAVADRAPEIAAQQAAHPRGVRR